jgi:hypothetical protein
MDRVADGALGIGDHRPADVADLFGRQPAPEPGWGSIFTEADVRLAALIIKTFDHEIRVLADSMVRGRASLATRMGRRVLAALKTLTRRIPLEKGWSRAPMATLSRP